MDDARWKVQPAIQLHGGPTHPWSAFGDGTPSTLITHTSYASGGPLLMICTRLVQSLDRTRKGWIYHSFVPIVSWGFLGE